MKGKNAFGLAKYEISDIFEDKHAVNALRDMFEDWLKYLEVNDAERNGLIERTFDSIRNYSTKTGILDENLRREYVEMRIIEKIRGRLKGRAEHIYSLIHPFLGNKILDHGCGDGSVAKYISNRKKSKIILSDVVDSKRRIEKVSNLPFYLIPVGTKLPFKDGEFDTSLLITVLHHADDPLFELDEITRVTDGNIVIIESVYGVCMTETPHSELMRFPQLYQRFHKLTFEQQRMYGTFLDWFLNKLILGNEINCPYNFNLPENWEKIFEKRGLKVEYKQMLGIDQMVTPEYHVLYVISNK